MSPYLNILCVSSEKPHYTRELVTTDWRISNTLQASTVLPLLKKPESARQLQADIEPGDHLKGAAEACVGTSATPLSRLQELRPVPVSTRLHCWKSWTVHTRQPMTSKWPFSSALTCLQPLTRWATTHCFNACRPSLEWQNALSGRSHSQTHSSSSSATTSHQQSASTSVSRKDPYWEQTWVNCIFTNCNDIQFNQLQLQLHAVTVRPITITITKLPITTTITVTC